MRRRVGIGVMSQQTARVLHLSYDDLGVHDTTSLNLAAGRNVGVEVVNTLGEVGRLPTRNLKNGFKNLDATLDWLAASIEGRRWNGKSAPKGHAINVKAVAAAPIASVEIIGLESGERILHVDVP